MNQTLAILLDGYRELNSKRLFWITLVLSGVFVGVFALFGVGYHEITFLKWSFYETEPEIQYKAVILKFFVIDVWLTWAASILALISTASIFPDFLTGGSVDLYLSKPISRLRLFLTKYVTGLLFVGLQVSAFSVPLFFVVGLRLKEWRPDLFLAIPLVLCFFSYIFAISVLLGVMTRSVIAAILLSVLTWFLFFGVQQVEKQSLFWQYANEHRVARYAARIKRDETQISNLKQKPSFLDAFGFRSHSIKADEAKSQGLLDESQHSAENCAMVHGIVWPIALALPKTAATVDLMDRTLFPNDPAMSGDQDQLSPTDPANEASLPHADESVLADILSQISAGYRTTQVMRARSVWEVIGTSLAFEAVIVGWAAWIFCRAIIDIERLTPSPGTKEEAGISRKDPHPNPLPEYRAREKDA